MNHFIFLFIFILISNNFIVNYDLKFFFHSERTLQLRIFRIEIFRI